MKFDQNDIPEHLPQNKLWCLGTKAYLYFRLKPWEVWKELGYSSGEDIPDPEQAWQDLKLIMELKRANTDKRSKPSPI